MAAADLGTSTEPGKPPISFAPTSPLLRQPIRSLLSSSTRLVPSTPRLNPARDHPYARYSRLAPAQAISRSHLRLISLRRIRSSQRISTTSLPYSRRTSLLHKFDGVVTISQQIERQSLSVRYLGATRPPSPASSQKAFTPRSSSPPTSSTSSSSMRRCCGRSLA